MASGAHVSAVDGRPRAPGPRGRLLFGSLADLRRDPLALLLHSRAEYGDVVRFRYLGPRSWHLFAHPGHVEQILLTRYQDFPKGVFTAVLDVIIPRGLVATEGPVWVRQRRLLQPGFTASRLESLADIIVDAALEGIAGWHERAVRGEPIDVGATMRRVALKAAAQTLLGRDLGHGEAVVERFALLALEQLDDRVLRPLSLLPYFPTRRRLAYLASRRSFDALFARIIERRRRQPTPDRHDLLAMILEARDEATGETMDDREALDHARTLLISGYETTGVSLGWLFCELAARPEIADRVRDEVLQVTGGHEPRFSDLQRLKYSRQVVDETLRLYPPIFWIGRQTARTCEVGGCRLDAGAIICLSPFVTHRHPEFWPEPERFNPEQVAPARLAGLPRGAYVPFGLGPRHCIGQHLSIMEMLLVLATVMPRWRFRKPDAIPAPVVRGTLKPGSPILVLGEPCEAVGRGRPSLCRPVGSSESGQT